MRNRIVPSYGNGVMIALLLLLGSSPTLAEEPIDRPASSGTETGQVTRRWTSSRLLNWFCRRKDQGKHGTPSAVASTPPAASELHRAQEGARDLSLQSLVSGIQPPDASRNISPSEPGPREPGPDLRHLGFGASEPAIGSGEPLPSGRDAESLGAAATEDARSLLMEVLGVPEDAPVKIRGWIENSFTGNANGRGNGINFGVNPNSKADQWMGNQYYLIVERPLKQEDKVNFGFRMDNMFGNDWQFTFMQGLFNRAFPNGWFPGYDMPQLFGEVHLPILTPGGLDIKGGRWYTIAGYESVMAPERTLLSVPYSFAYGQPFTHIGVLTTLHVTDKIDLYNGSINGWDRWINERYIWGYIGGFSWTSRNDQTKLAFTAIWGPDQFPSFLPANQPIYPSGYINIPSVAGLNNTAYHRDDRTLFTVVLKHKWTDKLTQVTGTGAGMERAVPGLGAPLIDGVPQNAQANYDTWYGFVNGFLYSFTDTLTGVWRSEVFWDTNGARTGQLVGDRYYEMTLGARYKPKDWLLIRPEVRYDWSQFHPAYSNDTRKSQLTLGFDITLLF
jgi:Putative beta-barrel porin-2, OmpL-like. bbp2